MLLLKTIMIVRLSWIARLEDRLGFGNLGKHVLVIPHVGMFCFSASYVELSKIGLVDIFADWFWHEQHLVRTFFERARGLAHWSRPILTWKRFDLLWLLFIFFLLAFKTRIGLVVVADIARRPNSKLAALSAITADNALQLRLALVNVCLDALLDPVLVHI
jgi:hypothetical protein